MNLRHVHTAANLAGSIYRIAYTSMLLYYLFSRRGAPPALDPYRHDLDRTKRH